ncbi:MAG TPA: bifunctional 4-hydroxy-3-methylbut-2-enyl diphosphate reductase/30S ribosomal protein S1 [Bacillota bacterium]|nr:bifunctional 4-hydroxy-3-methylbut-2-enyl diphosphate reductase/30S ribosomal protein S1 [Bacillota bacterium]
MEILVARQAGFCFGVKRAIKMAEEAAGQDREISSLGPLIHNRQVVARLSEKGIKPVDSLQDIPSGTVVIRSHGVGVQVLEEIEQRALKIVDATCPFVKKAQQLAHQLYEEGYKVVVVGDRSHPEVTGIVGWTYDQAVVVENAKEAEELARANKIGILAQTTQPVDNFLSVVRVLAGKCQELRVFNTICHATGERQDAAVELANQVDVMVVVGGTNSANTQKLARLCRDTGTPTHLIETGAELDISWLKGHKRIGLTAGASTPDWIIEEVKEKMTEIKEQPQQPEEAAQTDTMEDNISQADYMAGALNFNGVRRGDVVLGTVVQINEDEVLVDIGAKSEGVVPLRELTVSRCADPSDLVKLGDAFDVVVLKVDDKEGQIICSKQKADARKAMVGLEEAFKEGTVIGGTVTEVVKGGLLLDVQGVRAFLPASHADRRFVENLEQFVGKYINGKIIEFDLAKPRVVVSRKQVLEQQAVVQKQELLATLKEGDTRKGTVRRLTNFGAFIDLGGIDGLLHVSEMAWHRVNHPSEIVKEGDEIDVFVLHIDADKEKISLGLKQILRNPWENVADNYAVGSIVTGKVVRLAPFGAFVELEPGVDGLIHLSQLAERRIVKADEVVKVGQEVKVKVIDVKGDEKRISLSLKDADEAAGLAEAPETPEAAGDNAQAGEQE